MMCRIATAFALVLFSLQPAGAQEQLNCPTDADWGAPAALQLAPVPDGLRLSWLPSPDTPTDITGFEILRADGPDRPYVPVGIVDRSVNEFVDRSAVPGTIYYYRVRAFQNEVCTPFSDPVFGQR